MNNNIKKILNNNIGRRVEITVKYDNSTSKYQGIIQEGHKGPMVRYIHGTYDWWYNINSVKF